MLVFPFNINLRFLFSIRCDFNMVLRYTSIGISSVYIIELMLLNRGNNNIKPLLFQLKIRIITVNVNTFKKLESWISPQYMCTSTNLMKISINLRFQQIAFIYLINNQSKIEIYRNSLELNHDKHGRKKIFE